MFIVFIGLVKRRKYSFKSIQASVYRGRPLARVGSCSSPLTDTIIANYWAETAYMSLIEDKALIKMMLCVYCDLLKKLGALFKYIRIA